MLKKILILNILLVFSLVFFNQTRETSASEQLEPAANAGGLWHEVDGNRAYIHMRYTVGETVRETGDYTNDNLPEQEDEHYTVIEGGKEEDFLFPNNGPGKTATIYNPDPALYDRFVIEIITNYQVVSGPNPEHKTIFTKDNQLTSEITINLNDWADRPLQGPELFYNYDYSYMNILVDRQQVLTTRNVNQEVSEATGLTVNPNWLDVFSSFGLRMYWEKETTADTTNPANGWDTLPLTNGNPETPLQDWGIISDFTESNNNVSFNVNYKGTVYPVQTFLASGDLSFIEKANDILYYTDPDTEDRILYFNFGQTLDSAILTAISFNDVTEWKGEALWNLTQNEIKVTDTKKVYNYIPEVDQDGNVYSYFYMPDVPIESLVSVSAVLAYRYWDDGFLNIGQLEPGETQYKTVAAVRGEYSSVNPVWVEKTYQTSYITGGIVAAGTIAGIVPGYGWGISAAAFLVGGALHISDVNEFFAYDVEQIQHVIPDVALATEINTYIGDQYSGDTFTADTDKLYKLHLATLQGADAVQVLGDLSKVTQVVWETEGTIYVINDPDIEDIDFSGPGTTIPPEMPGNADLEKYLLYIAGGFGIYIIISSINFRKNKGLFFIMLAAGVYVLYKMGLI